MATTHTRAPLAFALLFALACDRERREAPVPTGPTIEISVDDHAPRQASITVPQSLASVTAVSPASWVEVIATTDDGRTLELARPATTYPDAEVRLYLDQQRPALGVFRRAAADMPREVAAITRQPIVSLAEITEVVIRTRERPIPPLAVRVDGRDEPVAQAMRALKLHPTRRPRERGWVLGDIVALAVPEDRLVRTVRLRAQSGTLTLDAQVLQSPDAILKQNQRGQYVFRMWDNRGKSTHEARGVTAIEIE